MADPKSRWATRLAAQTVLGACGLGALVWAVWQALRCSIAYEEPLDPFWFALYKSAGWGLAGTIGVISLLAALHLAAFGREDIRPLDPGDAVRWWGVGERVVHWIFVASFGVLLVTGLQLFLAGFGLPGPFTRFMRRWHLGEPFWLAGGALFLLWVRDAWPRRYDGRWLAQAGGYLRSRRGAGAPLATGEPGAAAEQGPLPAGRFNAGQKLWFWLELLTAVVMAVTGYEMQHHYTRLDDGYLTLFGAHLGAAWLFLAVVAVHFYLAVVGVRGALGGMIHGRVGRRGAERLHPEAEALKRADAR